MTPHEWVKSRLIGWNCDRCGSHVLVSAIRPAERDGHVLVRDGIEEWTVKTSADCDEEIARAVLGS